TSSDSMPSWSNFGAKAVDLAAPGSSVYTTSKDSGYKYASGTSFASPNVAGIAALMRSQYPAVNVRKLRLMILEGTDTVPSHLGKTVTGGRANAYSAFTAVMPWAKTYTHTLPAPRTITDNDPAGITETINAPHDLAIRAVSVFVEVDHPWMGDVALSIESPAGTANTLQEARVDANSGFSLTFDTQLGFHGESSAGNWTLTASDQALCAEYIIQNADKLEKKVYDVPVDIDKGISSLKLKTMGIEIDTLTEQQKEYLASWNLGT
ncbi:MAG: S8 family serine peptidase, partial [Planctomycetes bacterium]|nr:S8 family serine peptidase [Planctomycetota bacterium]